MALNRNVTLDEYEVIAHIADFTTGTPAAYTRAMSKGEVIKVAAVQHGTSAGSTNTITVSINGTAITGGTIPIVAGAAGAVTTTLITNPGITARVDDGDTIGFVSDGAANDGTVPATYIAVMRNRRG